jgi:hypothetical protein
LSTQANGQDLVAVSRTRAFVHATMRGYFSRIGLDPSTLAPRVVHVAGTKGKGSTSAFVESILRAHGLRTGGLLFLRRLTWGTVPPPPTPTRNIFQHALARPLLSVTKMWHGARDRVGQGGVTARFEIPVALAQRPAHVVPSMFLATCRDVCVCVATVVPHMVLLAASPLATLHHSPPPPSPAPSP